MKNIIYIHPFLLALHPVLFLYASNKQEFMVDVLLVPSLIVLMFAAVIFGGVQLIIRRTPLAAVATSIVVFFWLSGSRVIGLLQNTSPDLLALIITNKGMWAVIFIIFFGLTYALANAQDRILKGINQGLVVLAATLIATQVISIIAFELKTQRLWQKGYTGPATISAQGSSQLPSNQPDIYYLVFDRYASQRGLQEKYAFDNSGFTNYLQSRGFYVATEATTNYPKTFLSLASSMNMEYLDALLPPIQGEAGTDQSPGIRLLKNNSVVSFLQDQGYQYVHVGSWWSPTASDARADHNFTFKYADYSFADEFTTGFVNTTIAGTLANKLFESNLDVSSKPSDNLHRRSILYEFDKLKKIPQMAGPKFVFAHVLIPHSPFVFDRTCQPISEAITNMKSKRDNYIEQLECANMKIRELVDDILAQSKNDPIIILQADEGPFPLLEPFPDSQPWATASDSILREKFPILNAYYLPDGPKNELYPSITPVNTFRVILNTYFNADLPLLPDKNYVYNNEKDYYTFSEVTDRVR